MRHISCLVLEPSELKLLPPPFPSCASSLSKVLASLWSISTEEWVSGIYLPTYLPINLPTIYPKKYPTFKRKQILTHSTYIQHGWPCENMMLNELFLSQKDTRHMISLIPSVRSSQILGKQNNGCERPSREKQGGRGVSAEGVQHFSSGSWWEWSPRTAK